MTSFVIRNQTPCRLVVQALQGAEWLPMLLAWRDHDLTSPPNTLEFPRPTPASSRATRAEQTQESGRGAVLPRPLGRGRPAHP